MLATFRDCPRGHLCEGMEGIDMQHGLHRCVWCDSLSHNILFVSGRERRLITVEAVYNYLLSLHFTILYFTLCSTVYLLMVSTFCFILFHFTVPKPCNLLWNLVQTVTYIQSISFSFVHEFDETNHKKCDEHEKERKKSETGWEQIQHSLQFSDIERKVSFIGDVVGSTPGGNYTLHSIAIPLWIVRASHHYCSVQQCNWGYSLSGWIPDQEFKSGDLDQVLTNVKENLVTLIAYSL